MTQIESVRLCKNPDYRNVRAVTRGGFCRTIKQRLFGVRMSEGSSQEEAMMAKKNDLVNRLAQRPFDPLGVGDPGKPAGFRLAVVLLALIVLASLVVQPASAGGGGLDFYVAKTGHDTSTCLVDPCLTVAYAVTQAGSGNRIHIAAGTYAENLTVNQNLTFYGAGMNATLLDGSGLASVIVATSAPTVSIQDLTIRNGNATLGGGIAQYGGTLTLSRVKLTGNLAQSGGGIYSSGALSMTDCVVSANNASLDASSYGGGLYLTGEAVAVNLVNVTISGNTATGNSGGIHNQGTGTLNLTNVTISGNTAKQNGAMSSTNSATLTILNSTIANNHFSAGGANGGIGNYATTRFKNTILAGNDGMNCSNGTGGSLVSQGYNLDSGSSCTLTSTGDLQNTDPVLGPLADNGGPTQTHALLLASILHARSPAIDAGTNSGCPATDQRGVSRPQGAHCDMGAYEVRYYPIYLPLISR